MKGSITVLSFKIHLYCNSLLGDIKYGAGGNQVPKEPMAEIPSFVVETLPAVPGEPVHHTGVTETKWRNDTVCFPELSC